jgi:hypothetical protein
MGGSLLGCYIGCMFFAFWPIRTVNILLHQNRKLTLPSHTQRSWPFPGPPLSLLIHDSHLIHQYTDMAIQIPPPQTPLPSPPLPTTHTSHTTHSRPPSSLTIPSRVVHHVPYGCDGDDEGSSGTRDGQARWVGVGRIGGVCGEE